MKPSQTHMQLFMRGNTVGVHSSQVWLNLMKKSSVLARCHFIKNETSQLQSRHNPGAPRGSDGRADGSCTEAVQPEFNSALRLFVACHYPPPISCLILQLLIKAQKPPKYMFLKKKLLTSLGYLFIFLKKAHKDKETKMSGKERGRTRCI